MRTEAIVGQWEDMTEATRRRRLAEINVGDGRPEMERRHGTVWDSMELAKAFEIIGFMAPLVVARRKADGRMGSLEFQHQPRFYFNWQEDR